MRIEVGETVYVLLEGFWKQGKFLKVNDYGVCLVELGTGKWVLREEEEIKTTEQMTVIDWRNYGGYGKKIKALKQKSKAV